MWDHVISVLRQMMIDRGWTGWADGQTSDVYIVSNSSSSMMIYLCRMEKFNIESVKYMIYQLQLHKLKHALVVFQSIITSSARKAIEHLQDYMIEMFEKKEVSFHLTHHRFFCPHVRVPPKEVARELNNVDTHCLPVLLRTDVVSRYYYFSRGDVVRIHRKNGSIAYRLVK